MLEWQVKTIKDLGKVVTGKTPSKENDEFYNDGELPFVSPKDLDWNSYYVYDTQTKVTEKAYDSQKNQRVPKNSVFYTSLSFAIGKIGIASRESLTNQQIHSIVVNDKHDYKFVYYLLQQYRPYIFCFNSGIDTPIVPKSVFEKINVVVPELEVQKKIAAVLSAYDDLIENNKKRIQILENMAEELYKEWFVRFHFPNWENTEFKKGIPKNWAIVGFSELVSINPKESLDKNETYRFVGMEYLSTDSSFFYSDEYRLGNAGSKFRNGDILFPRITPCVENGKKGLVSTLKENEVACGSTEFIVFREKVLPKEYIYLLCKQSSFRQHAEQSMIGASGRQRVTLNCFNKFYLPLPNNELLKEFTRHTQSYFSLIVELHVKNRKLAEIRDSLLPRLISGKLSVEELDIQFPPSMQEQ